MSSKIYLIFPSGLHKMSTQQLQNAQIYTFNENNAVAHIRNTYIHFDSDNQSDLAYEASMMKIADDIAKMKINDTYTNQYHQKHPECCKLTIRCTSFF